MYQVTLTRYSQVSINTIYERKYLLLLMLQEITGQFIYHMHQYDIAVGAHIIPLIIQGIALNHLVLRTRSCRWQEPASSV